MDPKEIKELEIIASLKKVQEFLTDNYLQTKKSAIFNGPQVEIFRGVQFHIETLQNAKEVEEMLPLPIEELKEIKSIKDTIYLGDLMIDYGILVKVKQFFGGGPSMGDGCCGGGGPSSKVQKLPDMIETCDDDQVFEEGGLYYTVKEKPNTAVLGIMFVALLTMGFSLICIQYWPAWVIDYIYIGAQYLAVPILGIFYSRIILWFIFYHFGISLWILPNWTYCQQFYSPLFTIDFDTDYFDISFILPRLISLGSVSTGVFKLHEYIMSRIEYRGKNETIEQYVRLFAKKYLKTKYTKQHQMILAAFYTVFVLAIVWRQTQGKPAKKITKIKQVKAE